MTRPIFKSSVELDFFTQEASRAFDYQFSGESTFEGWEKPTVPEDFRLGLIVGPSGSGKSLLLKEFGKEETPEWASNKAVVSQFSNPEEAINRLMAVGLNSIPSWCKPYQVLSNGEQFRANLARKIRDNAVIDEFTSVVDRNVAKSASVSLRRFVDKNDIHRVVVATCHYDILEWLRPDWYFDTTEGILHDGRLLRRPAINLRIYPCKRSVWSMFAKHHYLTDRLNASCHAFLATAQFSANDEVIVGFASSITLPSGTLKRAWREHRTVVLPDFQGLGLGPRISDAVAQLHVNEGKRYFSRTAHPRFGAYRDRSSLWRKTGKYKKKRLVQEQLHNGDPKEMKPDCDRLCFAHEYIGKPDDWLAGL